jgi:hypothetical protein
LHRGPCGVCAADMGTLPRFRPVVAAREPASVLRRTPGRTGARRCLPADSSCCRCPSGGAVGAPLPTSLQSVGRKRRRPWSSRWCPPRRARACTSSWPPSARTGANSSAAAMACWGRTSPASCGPSWRRTACGPGRDSMPWPCAPARWGTACSTAARPRSAPVPPPARRSAPAVPRLLSCTTWVSRSGGPAPRLGCARAGSSQPPPSPAPTRWRCGCPSMWARSSPSTPTAPGRPSAAPPATSGAMSSSPPGTLTAPSCRPTSPRMPPTCSSPWTSRGPGGPSRSTLSSGRPSPLRPSSWPQTARRPTSSAARWPWRATSTATATTTWWWALRATATRGAAAARPTCTTARPAASTPALKRSSPPRTRRRATPSGTEWPAAATSMAMASTMWSSSRHSTTMPARTQGRSTSTSAAPRASRPAPKPSSWPRMALCPTSSGGRWPWRATSIETATTTSWWASKPTTTSARPAGRCTSTLAARPVPRARPSSPPRTARRETGSAARSAAQATSMATATMTL